MRGRDEVSFHAPLSEAPLGEAHGAAQAAEGIGHMPRRDPRLKRTFLSVYFSDGWKRDKIVAAGPLLGMVCQWLNREEDLPSASDGRCQKGLTSGHSPCVLRPKCSDDAQARGDEGRHKRDEGACGDDGDSACTDPEAGH